MKFNLNIGNNLFWFIICFVCLTILVQIIGLKWVVIAYIAWELTR